MNVTLSDEDRATLSSWTRKASGELRRAKRAAVVLALADGLPLAQAARRGGMHRHSAALWRDRFLEGGTDALGKDRPRPGKPKTIPAQKEEEIVRLTRLTAPEGATHWSTRTMAEAAGVSPASVQRIWASRGLKPHLVRTFKLSKDPDFESKLVDVVGLYLDPPERALVLCVDEKSQIQARERTRAPLPRKEGRPATATHDHKRPQAPRHDHALRRPEHAGRQASSARASPGTVTRSSSPSCVSSTRRPPRRSTSTWCWTTTPPTSTRGRAQATRSGLDALCRTGKPSRTSNVESVPRAERRRLDRRLPADRPEDERRPVARLTRVVRVPGSGRS